jgi:hypothetical protein
MDINRDLCLVVAMGITPRREKDFLLLQPVFYMCLCIAWMQRLNMNEFMNKDEVRQTTSLELCGFLGAVLRKFVEEF